MLFHFSKWQSFKNWGINIQAFIKYNQDEYLILIDNVLEDRPTLSPGLKFSHG